MSILPAPSSLPPWLTPTTVISYLQDFSQTPRITVTSSYYQDFSQHGSSSVPLTKRIVIKTSAKSHSLEAAILHTLAFKLSLKINRNEILHSTSRSFLNVLYNVARMGQKCIPFQQSYRIQVEESQIPICETASDTIFVLDSRFTQKEPYFQAAPQKAIAAFNIVLRNFGFRQKTAKYDPEIHPTQPKQMHPFYNTWKSFVKYSLFHSNFFIFFSCLVKIQDDFVSLYTPQATNSLLCCNFSIAVFLLTSSLVFHPSSLHHHWSTACHNSLKYWSQSQWSTGLHHSFGHWSYPSSSTPELNWTQMFQT